MAVERLNCFWGGNASVKRIQAGGPSHDKYSQINRIADKHIADNGNVIEYFKALNGL